jgi:hypothetical protein
MATPEERQTFLDSLPESTRKQLLFYDQNFTHLTLSPTRDDQVIKLPAITPGKCRFCGKSEHSVTFKKVAHAIPESMGNKCFVSVDECDACNSFFGKGIETQFGSWSHRHRSLAQVEGKKGVPKSINQKDGWSVKQANNQLEFHMTQGHEIGDIDEVNKTVTVTVTQEPYTPIAVLKAFYKMAVSLMPGQEDLDEFKEAIAWLRNPDHTVKLSCFCPLVIETSISGALPFPRPVAALSRRKTDNLVIPYMQFAIAFGNRGYQILLCPSPNLQDVNFSVPPFPFPAKDQKFSVRTIDLSGTALVKNETETFVYGFESLIEN